MKAKANRSTTYALDPNVPLSPVKVEKGAKRFEDWHWGVGPAKVVYLEEDDYPESLIECGRLIRIHLRLPTNARKNESRHPRRERDSMIEFSRSVSNNSHVGFDPDHQYERLYFIVDSKARPTLRRRLWDENPLGAMPLGQVATLAGGRHGKSHDYPDIEVKPVGVITALVYFTHKAGDESPGMKQSYYIHKMGELSHHFPILCCDADGRLWMAGGNYTTPNPGITD